MLLARAAAAENHGRVTFAVPVLALASAVLSAASTILVRRGYEHYGPYTAMWINVTVGTVCVWLAVAATAQAAPPAFVETAPPIHACSYVGTGG